MQYLMAANLFLGDKLRKSDEELISKGIYLYE